MDGFVSSGGQSAPICTNTDGSVPHDGSAPCICGRDLALCTLSTGMHCYGDTSTCDYAPNCTDSTGTIKNTNTCTCAASHAGIDLNTFACDANQYCYDKLDQCSDNAKFTVHITSPPGTCTGYGPADADWDMGSNYLCDSFSDQTACMNSDIFTPFCEQGYGQVNSECRGKAQNDCDTPGNNCVWYFPMSPYNKCEWNATASAGVTTIIAPVCDNNIGTVANPDNCICGNTACTANTGLFATRPTTRAPTE